MPAEASLVPLIFSGLWSDTTSTFRSMSLDDEEEADEVCRGSITKYYTLVLVIMTICLYISLY